MRATKIKMKQDCRNSNNLLEIDSIYIIGCDDEKFYKKEVLYDYIKDKNGIIQVNIDPYPYLIPALSINNEKYVKSTPDNIRGDNLLCLPRE